MAQAQPTNKTILLRADDEYQNASLDKFEKVLGNVLMAQTMLVNYYEDVIPNVQTGDVKKELEKFHKKAQEHKQKAEDLFRVIDREPSRMKEAMGGMMTKGMELMANVRGLGAGAYPDLQQLMMLELMSTGAFGTAMQIAVALGDPEAQKEIKPIVMEKFGHWRWFQETAMELAPVAILEDVPI